MGTERPPLATAAEILDDFTLERVQIYRLRGELRGLGEAVDDSMPEDQISVRTAVRKQELELGFRCEVLVSTEGVVLEVDAAVSFVTERATQIVDDAVYDFGDNVALMILFPYLRQSIADLGERLGAEVHLPLLRRGELSFRPEEGEDLHVQEGP